MEKVRRGNADSVSVLVAALDEEEGIRFTLDELRRYLPGSTLLVVDGNSTDRTVDVAKDMGAEVLFQEGKGKGDAIAFGLRNLNHDSDFLVLIDADYTYPAAYIPQMISILEENPQVGMVCGNRFNSHLEIGAMQDPFYFGNRFLAFTHNLVNRIDLSDPLTGLRVIRRNILRNWQPKSVGFDVEIELNNYVVSMGYDIKEIDIAYRERIGKKKLKLKDGFKILNRILMHSIGEKSPEVGFGGTRAFDRSNHSDLLSKKHKGRFMGERVSVVVSTYSKDNLGQVLDCLASLRKQSLQAHEILLVLDPVPEVLGHFKENVDSDIRIVESDGFGLSRARNSGIRNSDGEIVAFIDDDAVAHRDWLKKIVEDYSDPSVVGVGGSVHPLWSKNEPEWFPEELSWVIGCTYGWFPKSKGIIRNPIGCNMSFRRSALEKAGCFRSSLGRFGKFLLSGEESDVSLRIKKRMPDSMIINDPSAVVFHKINQERINLKYVIRRSFFEGVSKSLIANSMFDKSKNLAVERDYLKYIVRVSIYSRLKKIYRKNNLFQLTTLFLSSFAVFGGYLIGKIFMRKQRSTHNMLAHSLLNAEQQKPFFE
jgi:glycosyltransferase involved in cell wall biosynthesis